MRSHCNLHEHCLGVVHSATSRKSGGGPLFLPWPWRGALELLWGCDGVVTMLFPWVALVHPLYIPCTSLVHPLYIPCTSLQLLFIQALSERSDERGRRAGFL